MEDTDMNWRTASYSSNGGGECVEVADAARAILVRDSKDRDGANLSFPAETWQEFTTSLR